MKIGIFTLPLVNNYGGILQAYALSRVLVGLGHEPRLINLRLQRSKLSIAYLKFLVACALKKELRGASRFSSLLGSFGLEDRALQDPKDARLDATIDWNGVNEALRRKREDSMKFLKTSLGS